MKSNKEGECFSAKRYKLWRKSSTQTNYKSGWKSKSTRNKLSRASLKIISHSLNLIFAISQKRSLSLQRPSKKCRFVSRSHPLSATSSRIKPTKICSDANS